MSIGKSPSCKVARQYQLQRHNLTHVMNIVFHGMYMHIESGRACSTSTLVRTLGLAFNGCQPLDVASDLVCCQEHTQGWACGIPVKQAMAACCFAWLHYYKLQVSMLSGITCERTCKCVVRSVLHNPFVRPKRVNPMKYVLCIQFRSE